jgi:hypothetical protein
MHSHASKDSRFRGDDARSAPAGKEATMQYPAGGFPAITWHELAPAVPVINAHVPLKGEPIA